MTFDKPKGGIYACMCSEEKHSPSKYDTGQGTYYFCTNCGLQLTFKQLDNMREQK